MAIFNNPYPILSNSSGNFNECKAEFNCTLLNVEFQNNKYIIELKSEIVNESNLQQLLEEGLVYFSVYVESKPFFRRVFNAESTKDTILIEIDYREMSSEFSFEIFPKLIASEDFIYTNSNADAPMDEYKFSIFSKQKLAEHNKISIVFDRAYKLFDSGSLIHLCKLPDNRKPQNGFMDINVNDGYNIIVSLSEENFNLVKEMNRVNPKTLSTTISFPVIYHALSTIRENPNDFTEIAWAEQLDKTFDIYNNIESIDDILKLTDEILESPLIKLFKNTIKNEM